MKLLLIIMTFILCSIGYADEFLVTEVEWNSKEPISNYAEKQLNKLRREFSSKTVIKDFINEAVLNLGLNYISYKVIPHEDAQTYKIVFNFEVLERVDEVSVKGDIPVGFVSRFYTLRNDEFLIEDSLSTSIEEFENSLNDFGYPQAKVNIEKISQNDGVHLIYHVSLGKPQILEEIRIVGGDQYLKRFYDDQLEGFVNNPLNLSKIRQTKDEVDLLMKDHGYYSLKTKITQAGDHGIVLEINHIGPFVFNIFGNSRFSTFEIKKQLKDKMTFAERKVAQGIVTKIVETMYQEAGYYDTKVNVVETDVMTFNKQQTQVRFKIDIEEGVRVYVGNRNYKGNYFIKDEQLESLFSDHASSLAKNDMLDENFYEKFPDIVKKYYGENGYLLTTTRVKIPYVEEENTQPSVDIIIVEGVETQIESLKVFDIYEKEIGSKVLIEKLQNKVGQPINPYVIADDVKTITAHFRDQGYFEARVVNENHSNLVSYSKDARRADIQYIVERSGRYVVKNVFVFGNEKTKDKLISKRLDMGDNKYLTPEIVDQFKTRLFALGLFNSVSVYPRKLESRNSVEASEIEVDLIVRVSEIDYGKIELIPGLRSDFGVKLGFNVGYSNIGGMGRSLRLSSEINQRLNYNVFDDARNAEDDKFLEYRFNLGYTELDVFKTDISYLAEVGARRRRYFAFDANVGRLANTFSYKFTNKLEASLGHQYEEIEQFNGSTADDNGRFQIGSLIPSLSFDWRDSFTNPLKGGLHKINLEWADPIWFSQDGAGETISFFKYVLRNRFYIPFKNGTLALGWTMGVQKNLDDGFIPGIKTFRLIGADLVRGFSDEEINRLSNGEDISQFKVDDKAYLNSLKVEPRFYINENVMLGVFWDAGRVTVDRDEVFDLRQSVGLSFRVITPVGSINFDYGYKLDRKEYSTGEIESPGRFHLSIGLF